MKLIKKEALLHFLALIFFFALITFYRRWFNSPWYLMFWLGGIIGTLLPDLDHLIYTLFARPKEVTSQRVTSMLTQKQFPQATDLLIRTRHERTQVIFHTALFQVFFIIFAFLIISSSGSLLGRGIVLAFLLHLLVDQAKDYQDKGGIEHWFQDLPLKLSKTQISFYWVINFIILIVFGLFF